MPVTDTATRSIRLRRTLPALLVLSCLLAGPAASAEEAATADAPPPSARPAAPAKGAPAEESKFASSLYADSVSQKVMRVMTNWPSGEDGKRLLGSVVVQITIAEDGSLVEALPLRASGENTARLGSDIVQKVSAAAPFLPPPKSALNKQGQFQFAREFMYTVRVEKVIRPNVHQPRLRQF